MTSTEIISKLKLQKHPEGGWYKEVYRSTELIHANALPDRFTGDRHIGTSIYFLLESTEFSAFHRIKSDELWHFYSGSPIVIHVIEPSGNYYNLTIGKDFQFQCTVPANCWFAAEVTEPNSYALVGCTVSPGFNFEDFELAKRGELVELFPQYPMIITAFTK